MRKVISDHALSCLKGYELCHGRYVSKIATPVRKSCKIAVKAFRNYVYCIRAQICFGHTLFLTTGCPHSYCITQSIYLLHIWSFLFLFWVLIVAFLLLHAVTCMIWGSHSIVNEDLCLLGCDTLLTGKWLPADTSVLMGTS